MKQMAPPMPGMPLKPTMPLAPILLMHQVRQAKRPQYTAGMAIPMVLGLITVGSLLGFSLWMSNRFSGTRISKGQEMLQLHHLAEAGITEGFARIKDQLMTGVDLEKLKTGPFTLDLELDRRKGSCEAVIGQARAGRFQIRSKGTIQHPSGKSASGAELTLSAVVEVRSSYEVDPQDPVRRKLHHRCRLLDVHREDGPAEEN